MMRKERKEYLKIFFPDEKEFQSAIETEEKKEQIAKFLDFKFIHNGGELTNYSPLYEYPKYMLFQQRANWGMTTISVEQMRFEYDWNWIMLALDLMMKWGSKELIEKIRDTDEQLLNELKEEIWHVNIDGAFEALCKIANQEQLIKR